MRPQILINMHYLEIGGAETALIGLLNALDPDKVEVDLFLHDHRGEMMPFIPEWVHLLPAISAYTTLERPIVELVKRGFWLVAIARLLARFHNEYLYRKCGTKLANRGGFEAMARMTTPLLPRINKTKNYDLAISFCTPHRVVLEKVNARKKVAWIHTDYTKIWVNRKDELKVWRRYDHIVSISGDVTSSFLNIYPSLSRKIVEIENILSPNFVRDRARGKINELEMGGNNLCLLSVGRFVDAKNYDNVPDICCRVLKHLATYHVCIKWYIIGFGMDEELIRSKIAECGMEERVIILGKKENPYPYIKACDIYVQPSRYEGKSVTVHEAQMLCKPVVVTNYPTASSQIKNGIDGVIVPLDNEGCARGLAEFILDNRKQQQIIDYLSTHDYGNEHEVEKIYRLLGI